MNTKDLPFLEPGIILYNPVIKDRVTFLETAASTGGRRTRLHIELAPGGGNTMHEHDGFTETFKAITGELGVVVKGDQRMLRSGEEATVPINAPHRFFNPSKTDGIVFEVLLSPASPGFERSLAFAYGLAEDGQVNSKMIPKNFGHLAVLVLWSDTTPTGIISMILPVLKRIGRKVERQPAIHQRLQKYIARAQRVRSEALVLE